MTKDYEALKRTLGAIQNVLQGAQLDAYETDELVKKVAETYVEKARAKEALRQITSILGQDRLTTPSEVVSAVRLLQDAYNELYASCELLGVISGGASLLKKYTDVISRWYGACSVRSVLCDLMFIVLQSNDELGEESARRVLRCCAQVSSLHGDNFEGWLREISATSLTSWPSSLWNQELFDLCNKKQPLAKVDVKKVLLPLLAYVFESNEMTLETVQPWLEKDIEALEAEIKEREA